MEFPLQLTPDGWYRYPGNFATWHKGLGYVGRVNPDGQDWLGIYSVVPEGNTIEGIRAEGLRACGQYCQFNYFSVLFGSNLNQMRVVFSYNTYESGSRWGKTQWGFDLQGPGYIQFNTGGANHYGFQSPLAQTPSVFINAYLLGTGY